MQEDEGATKALASKASKKERLLAQLDLQSKLNLHSSNHSGELLGVDTQGSLAILGPKGLANQDYASAADPPVPAQ